MIDRQYHGGTFADLVVVQVAAVGSRRPRSWSKIAAGSDPHASEHGPDRKLQLDSITDWLAQPRHLALQVEIPWHGISAPFVNQVLFVPVGVNVLHILGSQGEQAQPIAGISPVAVQADAHEPHDERISRLGSLNVEGSGKRVARLRMALNSFVILARRIDGLGDYTVTWFDALQDWMPPKERAVIHFGFYFVDLAQHGRRRRQQRNQEQKSIPIHWRPPLSLSLRVLAVNAAF